MNKKLFFMCLVSCSVAQPLCAAELSNAAKLEQTAKIFFVLFSYLNDQNSDKKAPAISAEFIFYNPKKMTLTMDDRKVGDIKAWNLPIIKNVLETMKKLYPQFDTQFDAQIAKIDTQLLCAQPKPWWHDSWVNSEFNK